MESVLIELTSISQHNNASHMWKELFLKHHFVFQLELDLAPVLQMLAAVNASLRNSD